MNPLEVVAIYGSPVLHSVPFVDKHQARGRILVDETTLQQPRAKGSEPSKIVVPGLYGISSVDKNVIKKLRHQLLVKLKNKLNSLCSPVLKDLHIRTV